MPRGVVPPDQRQMAQILILFDEATGQKRGACMGRQDIFIDYPSPQGPEPEEARRICGGCHMVQICRDYARVVKPAAGVWGGELWVQGKVRRFRTARPMRNGETDGQVDTAPGAEELGEERMGDEMAG